MGVNKVEYGDEVLMDLTEDTVTPETLAEGTTAHDASGEPIVGTMKSGNVTITDLTNTTWRINDSPLLLTVNKSYNIDFTTNGESYTQFNFLISIAPILQYANINTSVTKNICAGTMSSAVGTTWIDTNYQYVMFTGGADVKNQELIQWLCANGEFRGYDTSNLATVDKIGEIYTNDGNVEINVADESGISWTNTFGIYDEDGELIKQGALYQDLPIVAGNNIEFEVDEENQKVKINAIGGGSTPSVSLIGTWTVIDEPEIPTSEIPLEFASNGEEFTHIGFGSTGPDFWGIRSLIYINYNTGYSLPVFTNNPSGNYGITHGWSNGIEYKYITVTKEPTDAKAIAWLGANTDAPKVELPKEEMPQIRFTNAEGVSDQSNAFVVLEDQPLKLTVEIVGGGALRVGDQLQVCRRKKFRGSTSNHFREKYKLQRFAEYVITEEDLDKQYLTVPVFNMGEGTAEYHALFRDGNAGNLSPLYLRIRRPKGNLQSNDSGQTVDAEFSNIVTIWKHHYRGEHTVRIQ